MPQITLTILNRAGLHARAAAWLARTARQFRSDITVLHGERQASARSILSLLALGAGQGAIITLRAEGEDADRALQALDRLATHDLEAGV
jgi:phosphotransferase system HPr (HPr) family protein